MADCWFLVHCNDHYLIWCVSLGCLSCHGNSTDYKRVWHGIRCDMSCIVVAVVMLQWKIRRVLAFSLHELALVLGSEVTCKDILPVFEEYCTKDIDDVKIGTLTHLADFFEVSLYLLKTLYHARLPLLLRHNFN